MEEPRTGERVGRYVVEAQIGRGSMGTVHRARRDDGQRFALKLLTGSLAFDDTYLRRFEREGRIASSFRHAHVAEVVEAGVEAGRPYLVSRLIDGTSLEAHIAAGPLRDAAVARLVAEVGSALDALHGAGLVHRDVKPGNILLDGRGAAVLVDFGLARAATDTVLTLPGRVSGTSDYLAPELILGEAATPASDIYALGCVAYECVAGTPPFGTRPLPEALVAHLQEAPAPLASPLSEAVLQALAKSPADRPPTATSYGLMLRVSVAE